MKKDFDFPLKTMEGRPIEQDGKPVTAATVAVNALLSQGPGDEPDGEAKARRYKLALAIHGGGGIDLKAEDIALIKRLIGLTYLPLVVGQMYDFLDA